MTLGLGVYYIDLVLSRRNRFVSARSKRFRPSDRTFPALRGLKEAPAGPIISTRAE